MAQGGINYKDDKQFIGGDHELDCFRVAFQAYEENVNYEFQEIRNILAELSLKLDGDGVTSTINVRKTQHHNHPMMKRQYYSKIELPTFYGYLDTEDFLVWSSKVEDCLRQDYGISREICNFIIDDRSGDNIISKILEQSLGLSTESCPKSPCKLWRIKKGPSIAAMEVYHFPLLSGKIYEENIKPWQFDVNATNHQKQSNISFIWHKNNTLIPPSSWSGPLEQKTSLMPTIILLDKWKKLNDEASKVMNMLIAREQSVLPVHVPHELQVLLKEYWDVRLYEFPDGLLPLRILHQVDLLPVSSLLNCLHCNASLSENEALNEIKIELLQNGFMQEMLDQLHGAITFSDLDKDLNFIGFVVGSKVVQVVVEAKRSKDAETRFNTLKGKSSTTHVLKFPWSCSGMGIDSAFSQEHHSTYEEKLNPARKKKSRTRGRVFLKQRRMMEYMGKLKG